MMFEFYIHVCFIIWCLNGNMLVILCMHFILIPEWFYMYIPAYVLSQAWLNKTVETFKPWRHHCVVPASTYTLRDLNGILYKKFPCCNVIFDNCDISCEIALRIYWLWINIDSVGYQAITRARVDTVLCRHLASLGHNELNICWNKYHCSIRNRMQMFGYIYILGTWSILLHWENIVRLWNNSLSNQNPLHLFDWTLLSCSRQKRWWYQIILRTSQDIFTEFCCV